MINDFNYHIIVKNIRNTYASFSPFTALTTESLLGIKVSVELSTEVLAGKSLDA